MILTKIICLINSDGFAVVTTNVMYLFNVCVILCCLETYKNLQAALCQQLLTIFLLVCNVFHRAFARWGTSYMKSQEYQQAIVYFDKSLTEHRIPETLKKRQEVGFNKLPWLLLIILPLVVMEIFGCHGANILHCL